MEQSRSCALCTGPIGATVRIVMPFHPLRCRVSPHLQLLRHLPHLLRATQFRMDQSPLDEAVRMRMTDGRAIRLSHPPPRCRWNGLDTGMWSRSTTSECHHRRALARISSTTMSTTTTATTRDITTAISSTMATITTEDRMQHSPRHRTGRCRVFCWH